MAERRDEDRPRGRLFAARLRDRGRNGIGAEGAGSAQSSREQSSRTAGELARTAGRCALWALLALVLVRGLSDIVAGSKKEDPVPAPIQAGAAPEEEAFAVRLARAFVRGSLPGGRGSRLEPFLSPELRDRFGASLPASGAGPGVVDATVAAVAPVSAARTVITVACILASGRDVRYVAVPVAQDAAGGLAAFDLPSIVAGPPAGQVEADAAAPLEGSEAPEIDRLVRRFLGAYVAGAARDDLSFFVAPGARVGSLPGGLELVRVHGIDAPVSEVPSRRSVVVTAEVRDSGSAAVYLARYRLELVQRERWYVESIQGEVV